MIDSDSEIMSAETSSVSEGDDYDVLKDYRSDALNKHDLQPVKRNLMSKLSKGVRSKKCTVYKGLEEK